MVDTQSTSSVSMRLRSDQPRPALFSLLRYALGRMIYVCCPSEQLLTGYCTFSPPPSTFCPSQTPAEKRSSPSEKTREREREKREACREKSEKREGRETREEPEQDILEGAASFIF